MRIAASQSQPSPKPKHEPITDRRLIPPLESGDRLTRAEFERRYSAMPQIKKAELIEGIVYMPSPVRLKHHGQPHARLTGWLIHYESKTPGVLTGDNSTARLDDENEPQPDVMLLIPKQAGGATKIDDDDYVSGAPDFVGEVAASTVNIDLHFKLEAYRRNGVKEYLVWRTEDAAIDWFILRDGQYQPLPTGEDGITRSETFPGLWLDPAAMLKGELTRVFQVVDQGVSQEAHAAFVRRLAGA
ncbi:MAG: Uma2 family endonuclease [Chthoniobacterales bacterium]|nr:Uma2 family endonuclease [Chthoniobacterales bacterium]